MGGSKVFIANVNNVLSWYNICNKLINQTQMELRKIGIILLFLLINFTIKAQTRASLENAEHLYNDDIKKITYAVGNVVFKHDGVVIMCDSAIKKNSQGIIEGFGHIYIYQPDTFNLVGGEYLRYDENTKNAIITGREILLNNADMILSTTQLNYNIGSQVGYYTNGARTINKNDTLISKKGYYHRRSNLFYFKDNVQLKSPDYTMNSDTLQYSASTKIAYFFGSTQINSGKDRILCKYGWYNTKNETAQFSKEAVLYSEANILKADSLLYNKKLSTGYGFGNLELTDTIEKLKVYGQIGSYNQIKKISIITAAPVARQISEKDTFWMLADTFYFHNDSANRRLRAFRNTNFRQSQFQGVCDSLVFIFRDSVIQLFQNPILWNDSNQISSDTILIHLANKKIHYLEAIDNAFLAAKIKTNTYNQIKGNYLRSSFVANKLKQVMVKGNAESIYYLRENESDTAPFSGVNKVACAKMLIDMDSSKVSGIRFYGSPAGKLHPVKEFPEDEKILAGLKWQAQRKPTIRIFTKRTEKRELPTQISNSNTIKKKTKRK